jgi:hypothetical protein
MDRRWLADLLAQGEQLGPALERARVAESARGQLQADETGVQQPTYVSEAVADERKRCPTGEPTELVQDPGMPGVKQRVRVRSSTNVRRLFSPRASGWGPGALSEPTGSPPRCHLRSPNALSGCARQALVDRCCSKC